MWKDRAITPIKFCELERAVAVTRVNQLGLDFDSVALPASEAPGKIAQTASKNAANNSRTPNIARGLKKAERQDEYFFIVRLF
jgi:hypothetical protein